MSATEGQRSVRTVEFVVKVSKFCNLRCQYCYEFEELGSREQMSFEDLQHLYQHVSDWAAALDFQVVVDFVWHGGEPLLMPPSFFTTTFRHQREIFPSDIHVRNTIQTNLTVLDEERLSLLREFDRVGVSLDLYGELRTNSRGADSVRRVLQNMDVLHSRGIDYGCITVLSGHNAPYIRKVIEFYHRLQVRSVRLLPLIDGASFDQHRDFDITPSGVLKALQEAFEHLVSLNSSLLVEPINGYVRQVIHHHTSGATPIYYDKSSWESVYLVNTNGDLYSYGNAYEPEFCHGNVFRDPMASIVHSAGHLRSIAGATERIAEVCSSCDFFGSCSGYPMAEEAPLQRRRGDPLECYIDRPMLEFVERRLTEMGVLRPGTAASGGADERGAAVPLALPAHVRPAQLAFQRDVRLHIAVRDGISVDSRVSLSSGTTKWAAQPDDGLKYIAEAVVPRAPFRPATNYEMEMLTARPGSSWRLGSDIAVVRIPDDVISPLMQVFEDFGTTVSFDDYHDHTSHPGWESAYGRLSRYVQQHHAMDGGEPRTVRLGTALPDSVTVTKDTVEGRRDIHYVGMHVDSWVDVPMHLRDRSQNRICVNVGRGDRYLLFINLGLARMNALLHGTELSEAKYYGSDLGHDFVRAFPDYPVIRLRVRSGEAYIAPTENVIHDGSTLGMTDPDLALHMIGALAPRATVDARANRAGRLPAAR